MKIFRINEDSVKVKLRVTFELSRAMKTLATPTEKEKKMSIPPPPSTPFPKKKKTLSGTTTCGSPSSHSRLSTK
jgi:hypothetical protein